MRWLVKACATSIGQKFLMGLTGLLLCGFLVVHLAGNLLLYAGPEAYNHYAHALHEQEFLVKVGEAVLIVLFAGHILLSFVTGRENRQARDVGYAMQASKQTDRVLGFQMSQWMLVTGLVVLVFLLLHVSDFTWQLRLPAAQEKEPFDKAVHILKNPLSFTIYVLGCLILGIHLGHGVQSAFQSLGINHPKYNGLIYWLGVIFAVVMAIGFTSFPLWALAQ